MNIDWSKFLAPEHERLAKPWVLGGRRFACNGFLAICVPTDAPDDVAGSFYQDIAAVLLATPTGGLLTWPADGFVQKEQDCVECGGCRYTDRVECTECGGRGEVVCPACDRPNNCDRCNGDGRVGGKLCTICCGRRGPLLHDVHQVVDGRAINAKYVRRILSLGAVMYYADGRDEQQPIRFTFAGDGRGAVMPLRLPAEERVA